MVKSNGVEYVVKYDGIVGVTKNKMAEIDGTARRNI